MANQRLSRIRDRFLSKHLLHWPEEATTLGLHDYDASLKGLSDEAIDDELAAHRESLSALQALDSSQLTADERLDVVMMTALHDFHLHVVGENQDQLINIEMSLHPYLMLQLQQRVAHDVDRWFSVSLRVSEIPRFLTEQQALLRRGARGGRTPDRDAVTFIANNQIAHIESFFAELPDYPAKAGVALPDATLSAFREHCLEAAKAYDEHASFLREEICPHADVRTLGEEEYAFRLKTTLGVSATPQQLIEQSRAILQALRAELLAMVQSIDRAVHTVDDALAFVMREKDKPLTERDEDVIPTYQRILDRALDHMRKHDLFHLSGEEVTSLGLEAPPPALTEIVTVTNVAAPLLDEAAKAFFLILPKAAKHWHIQAVPLALHEGIPGHGLQSIWWQANRERRAHPVRFICAPDDVAFARQYFGAMMNIEGWATYAELLMRESGFFTSPEAAWAIWAQMAHAARVIVDASLHTNRMTVPQAESFLSEQLGWSALAKGEVARYRRIPLQAVCYQTGRLEILDLRKRCRAQQGSDFSLADFHDRLFAAGPVAAGHLKAAWLS